jgi:hypothetical protein
MLTAEMDLGSWGASSFTICASVQVIIETNAEAEAEVSMFIVWFVMFW